MNENIWHDVSEPPKAFDKVICAVIIPNGDGGYIRAARVGFIEGTKWHVYGAENAIVVCWTELPDFPMWVKL